jgi:hypothetical protein
MLREIQERHVQLHRSHLGDSQAKRAAKDYVTRLDRYVGKVDVFSHVDKPGVTGVLSPGSDQITYALGPQRNARAFTFCASWALEGLLPLVDVLNNLRQLHGLEAMPDAQTIVQRVAEWQQRIGDQFAAAEQPANDTLT